jgi:Trk K+ transport system NAD-binding subunit
VIVCGLDGVGLRTVEQLHLAGVRVVVIDDHPDPRLTRVVRNWGVPEVTGSSRLAETLTEAGLAGAAAVVCVQADDLHTLETALLARELRPDVRVVVQIRNPAVGRALTGSGVSVLDVAGLSAPSVVEACLRTGAHEVDLAGERFVLVNETAPRKATLRALYGDAAPVAVVPAAGGDVVVCPGRDHPVAAGDTVIVFGSPEQLRAVGVAWRQAPRAGVAVWRRAPRTGHSGWSLRKRLRHAVGSLVQAADRRLALILVGLFVLLAASTTVLRIGYREPDGRRMSVLDALYFTVETVATVGYGDFSFREAPTWLRVYAIGLMIVGAMLATVFFALLTNLLVSRRIEESLGRRRVTGLSGHVVVIGLGSIGVRVVHQLLAADTDVVVVDSDEGNRYLAQVRSAGVPVVIADATQPETLRAVNLAEASAVAVLTSDDLVNLETGLAVRDQSAVPVVLRLFDRQLARTVESNFEIGLVRSTAALAAPWFVGAALGLDVLGTFYVDDTPMLIARLTVAPAGGLDGLAMGELSARTRVVAISRDGDGGRLEHPPRRGTRFRAGDRAYLLGPYEELMQVLRRDTLSPAQVSEAPGPPVGATPTSEVSKAPGPPVGATPANEVNPSIDIDQ